MVKIIKKNKSKNRNTLREFYQKRNKILLWHEKGGMGDVLVHRMIFEDCKSLIPEAEIIFACPQNHMDAAKDHPDISCVIDSESVDIDDYIAWYNTCVTKADIYEYNNAPCPENRSDIWAKFCGLTLKNHDMKFRLDENIKKQCKEKLEKITEKDKKTIFFAPKSAMINKSLLPFQIEAIVNSTKEFNLVVLHNKQLPEFEELNIPVINTNVKEWMCYLDCADLVISVDSAAFHMAGGLGKPTLGIFTWADGLACGKHYKNVEYVQLHRNNGNWDCGPCFKFADCPKCKTPLKPCLTEITKEMLEDGVSRLLKRFN